MVRIEWTISLTSGPVVGTADSPTAQSAWKTVTDALRAALGPGGWTNEHQVAMRGYGAAVRHEAPRALAATGRYELTSPGVAVVLTRV
jgi:hypothetical protein